MRQRGRYAIPNLPRLAPNGELPSFPETRVLWIPRRYAAPASSAIGEPWSSAAKAASIRVGSSRVASASNNAAVRSSSWRAVARSPARWRNAARVSIGELRQRFPDLPVVMVTAYGDDERRQRAAEYGAADFHAKPVDFEHPKAQLRQLPGVPD